MTTTAKPQGCLPSVLAWFLGPRAARLREQTNHTHWLSYLLIIAQSVAVVLVFGHAEVPLLLSAIVAIRALALMVLTVLIITVIAADVALLETLARIPALSRNRQNGALAEHIWYVLFVLATEGSTYAVVLAAIDSDPQALVSGRPLIPTAGPFFTALVILRVVLICWSAVQLIIVKSKLPVLLSTLMTQGKEIVGAHNLEQMRQIDVSGVPMVDTFSVYQRMSQAPRPIRTWWNGWLVRRALAREAEEERQANNVREAMEQLEQSRQKALGSPLGSLVENHDHHITAERAIEAVKRDLHPYLTDYPPASDTQPSVPAIPAIPAIAVNASGGAPTDPEPPDDDDTTPPDGSAPTRRNRHPLTPAADANVTPIRRSGLGRGYDGTRRNTVEDETSEEGSNPTTHKRVRTPARRATRATRKSGGGRSLESEARAAWTAGAHSVDAMQTATGMGRSAASSWVRTLKAERSAMTQEGA